GERIGRYSFLGTNPFLSLTASGKKVQRRSAAESATFDSDDPLGELERLVGEYRAPHVAGLPRFCGGAVGYAGYDTVRYVETLPKPPNDDRRLPDLAFSFYDRMVIFDNLRKTILVIAHADVRTGNLDAAYRAACQRVDELCNALSKPSDNLQLADI